ncbi:MAG: hypothetical protein JNL09_02385 [Anaerolineales bacterium]|nr:hypothetical protein [Anaerolineales bacterium]
MNLVFETQQLQKDFGQKLAVQDLNLHVATGQVFGFLGPNGAGGLHSAYAHSRDL